MKQKGSTLMELLVVMAVLAIAGTFIFNIFTSTLRGNNKTQVIGVIKQNGQAVLETMDKTVRNADNVVCPYFLSPADTIAHSNTVVTVKDGIYTRFRFIPPTNNINPALGNNCGTTRETGCLVRDNPVKQNREGISPPIEETDPQFVTRICNVGSQMLSDAVTLTDTNPKTGISMNCFNDDCIPTTNAIFTRDRSSGFKDQVAIRFIAGPGVEASEAVRGQIDPVLFQTTISLR